MSSRLPLPSIPELVRAFHDGVRGTIDKREDYRSGSAYDLWAGPAAVLFSRECQRDRDLFRATYFGEADGSDLTALVAGRYGIARNVDAYGAGTMTLSRPTSGAGAGTFYAGTRIAVYGIGGRTEARIYEVTADTAAGASDLSATVNIDAKLSGPGSAISASATAVNIAITDTLWDSTWVVQSLTCGDGTAFELAQAFRARVSAARLLNRVGYRAGITTALQNAGAAHVALYASNYAGDANDYGLNVAYVGDASYTGTPALVQACTLALESVRVAGADLAVLPMASGLLSVKATACLWDDPARFNTDDLRAAMVAQAQDYFAPLASGYAYRLDALSAAMSRGLSAVQSVTFTQPTGDLSVMSGSTAAFPNVLTKWALSPSRIQIAFAPPQ